MKKTTLLLAICFAFQFNLNAQCPGGTPAVGYICIPDAALETFLFSLGVDSVDGDNRILKTEAEAWTSYLNFSGQGITDFSGIEAFINLTSIRVSNNPATSIDLTSNMSLIDINASITNYTSIDLSGNPNLVDLNVSYSPLLTSLNLTDNMLLTDVNAEECNSLATLDITGLTTLVNLNFYNNDLSAIDVLANLSLESLIVRQNNLTILDLSSNGALTNLNARNNLLTSLDMRNGNNANVTFFNSDFNGSLVNIFVDDCTASYLTALPWQKDAASTFVNDGTGCPTLSVSSTNELTFDMYPNPAKNSIYVASNLLESQIQVYDITGKLVLIEQMQFGENAIDISAMTPGVYLARILANGKSQTKKLLIQ